ncbi:MULTISPECIES: hypothetical protein [Leptolyngbya]
MALRESQRQQISVARRMNLKHQFLQELAQDFNALSESRRLRIR